MMTNEEWELRYRDFAEVIGKLDEKELQTLASIFECFPHYVGYPVQKHFYVEFLWSKFRDLRRGEQHATEMRDALIVLHRFMPRN